MRFIPLIICLLWLLGLLLGGCTAQPAATTAAESTDAAEPPTPRDVSRDDDVARLASRAAATAAAFSEDDVPPARIDWDNYGPAARQNVQVSPPAHQHTSSRDVNAHTSARNDKPTTDVTRPRQATTNSTQTVGATTDTAATPPSANDSTGSAAADSRTRNQLLADLLAAIQRGGDDHLSKALTAATLSVIDGRTQIDPAFLTPLKPDQREKVERYQRVVIALSRQLAKDGSQLDPDTMTKQLDTLMGPRAMTIRKVELCKRVRGYGVFESFAGSKFIARKQHAMIVYAELDHFSVKPARDAVGQQEVRLSQQIELYNEADGLVVWRHEPVSIVDRSRNRRRDFFVVQLIKLPPTLTVGKYVLNVRINDLQGGTVDEVKVPIDIVADQSVVGALSPKKLPLRRPAAIE